MSKELEDEKYAEISGILLGDGCITLKENNPKSINRLKISLNSVDDLAYIYHVKKLLQDTCGEEAKVKNRKNENTTDIMIFKKKVVLFFIQELGLQISPKWERAIIPERFMQEKLDLKVLQGYFDTDGCLVTANNNGTIYPRLEMKVCPSPMQKQFIEILKKYDFRFGVYEIGNGEVRIQLNGKEQLRKWIGLVGFNNKKHSEKIKRFNLN